MTSPAPLLYDTYYHIYNRGNNGENIFIEERNYEYFLKLYEKHITPIADTFAYCFLRNHHHIEVRTKSKEEIAEWRKSRSLPPKKLSDRYLSDQFSNFYNAYAKTINLTYGRTGSLFEHPFGRVPITSDRQFWNVVAYIHQNPQKHGFVKDFRDWKYSSYGIILTEKRTIIKRDEVMKWFGTKEEYLSLHSDWVTDAQAKWFAGDDYD
jgi:hypothetical protein